ncbi:MAG: helix-hairpin-helix domain-containing protein [Myxococcales bacterium]|nr:helix-hairpin-helix domain-containing protein [Myxococcales bacterium]
MRPNPADPQASAANALVVCLSLVALAHAGAPWLTTDASTDPLTPGAPSSRRNETMGSDPNGAARADSSGSSGAARLRDGKPLDLNLASPEDLQLLPRVGPRLAERIVAHRQQHGPFEAVEDLTRVRGIGAKTLAGLRPMITVQRRDAATAGLPPGEPGSITKARDNRASDRSRRPFGEGVNPHPIPD